MIARLLPCGAPSCSSTIAPGCRSRTMRETTSPGSPRTPSKPRALQATRASPCSFNGAETNGLAMPTTARNQRGATPVIWLRIAWDRPISAAMRRGPSAQNQACGCEWLWLPMPWPRRRISRASSGRAAARSATRKNVALASCRSSRSSTASVSCDGPSSTVSQTAFRVIGSRLSTGPNNRDCGRIVPHRNSMWTANRHASPDTQPHSHQATITPRCRASASQIHACGWRGTRCSVRFSVPGEVMPQSCHAA